MDEPPTRPLAAPELNEEATRGLLPAVTSIKEDAAKEAGPERVQMERTASQHIREEREDLKEAAEQSLNVILDLTTKGVIRWVSPSWERVVGTPVESVQGKPIADLLLDEKSAFSDAVATMRQDDSRSVIVHCALESGPKLTQRPRRSKGLAEETQEDETTGGDEVSIVNLEAQGILVYDRASGEESHTMWMIRPAVLREVTIDLPGVLVEALGVGAEMLAQHLTTLAEAGADDPEQHPSPLPVLCRICERQITPWWFPKHTELCLQEHQAEAELQMAQDSLTDHRNAIVKVLDALELQMRAKQKTPSADRGVTTPPPQPEYKGQSIGPPSSASSAISSGRASPVAVSRSREHSASGHNHQRGKSFAVRRPLARNVELILDLCDTALEISTPTMKESRGRDEELRTQSPQSEGRISEVLNWQPPSQAVLENEPGLSSLSEDTTRLCKAKLDSIMLYRRILEYSERIRSEFTALIQECIDAALDKAAKIAAGEDSSSGEETSSQIDQSDNEPTPAASSTQRSFPATAFDSQLSMSTTLLAAGRSPSPVSNTQPRPSSVLSTRSSSPKSCPTPKSSVGPSNLVNNWSQVFSSTESDRGNDSDSTAPPSAIIFGSSRAESPSLEMNLSRTRSSRDRKRTSLVLPRTISSGRSHSPARGTVPPVSPLRIAKPRVPSGGVESTKSPITSPIFSSSEFHSPNLTAQKDRFHRRQSSVASSEGSRAPQSPRLSFANNLQPRAVAPSIRDFEIIKPISKGAFGSVYLAKKKLTGDYYAIKALKKADMIAKNQVANIKAERAILMWEGASEFVAKLYWTFPSKDYIFLVMEYLNGGDCASLIKALGSLPEDWAKRYIAEVVQGVDHLHKREIVHRDLKPDNLLIDQKGRLKLTDFGLSRMGLIGRQKRALTQKSDGGAPDLLKHGPFQRAISMSSSRSTSFDHQGTFSPGQTPSLTPAFTDAGGIPSYFNLSRESSAAREPVRQSSGHQSDYGDSESLSSVFKRFSLADDLWNASRTSPPAPGEESAKEEESSDGIPLQQILSNIGAAQGHTSSLSLPMQPPAMALFDPQDSDRRFVGTPDYLAPETINGGGQDEISDWWSLGCILFEFIYGYPPFHAETPDKVFDNILTRNIDWPPGGVYDVSEEAKDLMNKMMCIDPAKRLGSNVDEKYSSGGEEIKNHPWFSDIDWDTLGEAEASFVPASQDPEDTEYFDARGATMETFASEFEDQATSPVTTPNSEFERPHDALSKVRSQFNSVKRGLMPLHIPPHVRDQRTRRSSEPAVADDFGQFSFKNLPVLEKANKDVIQKLRAEAMQAQARQNQAPPSATAASQTPQLEGSPMLASPLQRNLSVKGGPKVPSLQTQNSSPVRNSQPSSPLVQFSAGQNHERRKTSSGSSSLSTSAGRDSLQPLNLFDLPRFPAALKIPSASSSPIKSAKTPGSAGEFALIGQRQSSGELTSPRSRSQTVGSTASDGDFKDRMAHHQKHKSQVLDISPSSSDTDDPRQKVLLRVQRRRQSSRRMSQITLSDGPIFRPLDILVCEDHPVSRLVMEKNLEKLRCRTIIVQNGAEAMRYALSSVKFDVIMMEFKLPQISGADIARMIRDTRNANCQTPLIAVTGYLKELLAPHHFDALIEKPATIQKLTNVLSKLCQWRPPPPGWDPSQMPPPQPLQPSSLRKESMPAEDSPISISSGYAAMHSSSYRGSSRDDSVSSVSAFGDSDQIKGDDLPIISRTCTDDWQASPPSGLGISGEPPSTVIAEPQRLRVLPVLEHPASAPAALESKPIRKSPSAEAIQAKKQSMEKDRHECAESGDDEDDELGNRARSKSPRNRIRPSSKLGTEMMRTNSQGSVISAGDTSSKAGAPLQSSPPTSFADHIIVEEDERHVSATTPPEIFARAPGNTVKEVDMDAEPILHLQTQPQVDIDPDPTPKGNTTPSQQD